MRKFLALAAFVFVCFGAPASTVTFTFTNSIGQADLHTIQIFPLNPPTRGANYSFVSKMSIKLSPDASGTSQTNLMQGTYNVVNDFLGQGITFSVPNDTNTYAVGQLQADGFYINTYAPFVKQITSNDGSLTVTPSDGHGTVNLSVVGGGGGGGGGSSWSTDQNGNQHTLSNAIISADVSGPYQTVINPAVDATGVSDASAILNAAVALIATNTTGRSSVIQLPAGIIKLSSAWVFPGLDTNNNLFGPSSGLEVRGMGSSTIIDARGITSGSALVYTNIGYRVRFRDFVLIGPGVALTTSQFREPIITLSLGTNYTSTGLAFGNYGGGFGGAVNFGLQIHQAAMDNVDIFGFAYGLGLTNTTEARISHCRFFGNTIADASFVKSDNLAVWNCSFGWQTYSTSNVKYHPNWVASMYAFNGLNASYFNCEWYGAKNLIYSDNHQATYIGTLFEKNNEGTVSDNWTTFTNAAIVNFINPTMGNGSTLDSTNNAVFGLWNGAGDFFTGTSVHSGVNSRMFIETYTVGDPFFAPPVLNGSGFQTDEATNNFEVRNIGTSTNYYHISRTRDQWQLNGTLELMPYGTKTAALLSAAQSGGSTADMLMDNNTSGVRLYGGSFAGGGAGIQLYGASHATLPGQMYLDTPSFGGPIFLRPIGATSMIVDSNLVTVAKPIKLNLGTGVAHSDASGNITSSSVALSDMASETPNTVLGNFTGSPAAPQASTTIPLSFFANQGTTATVLHGNASGNPAFGPVVEADQSLSDVTTGNADLTHHGYLRKLDGNSSHYVDGNGNLTTPAGSGGVQTPIAQDVNYAGFNATNIGQLSAAGITNLAASPNTVAIYDARGKLISLANGGAHTFLQGTTPPTETALSASDLPPLGTAYPQALTNGSVTVFKGVGTAVVTNTVSLAYPTLYVSPYGLTNNPGTPLLPLPMPYALTVVGGGTLKALTNFPASSYWDLTATNSGLTIEPVGYPNNCWNVFLQVTNSAAASIFIEPGVSNVTVQGMEILNNTNQDGIKFVGAINTTLRDNYLHNNVGNGMLGTAINTALIERNLMVGNGTNNTDVGHYHGSYLQGTNITYRNNVCYDNTNGYGAQFYPSNNVNLQAYNNLIFKNNRGMVISAEAGLTNYAFNNTIVSNTSTAIQLYGTTTGTVYLTNNIILNNGNGSIASAGGLTVIEDYNLVESAVSSPGTHDVVALTAGAVNGTKGLYWLTSSSAAKGAAVNQPPPVDFFGYPQTSVSDIGCFQFFAQAAYDTRTLYHSSFPAYWDNRGFAPDLSTSLSLFNYVSDPTGAGSLVFANSPTLSAPLITSATASTFAGFDGTKFLGSASLPSSALSTALTDETGFGLAVFSGSPTVTNLLAKGDVFGTNALYIDKTGVTISNNISQVKITNGTVYASGPASVNGETNRTTTANQIEGTDANNGQMSQTLSAWIDAQIGSTRGSILERGASGWGLVTPGASGTFLGGNGAGADPSYQTPAGGGGGTNSGPITLQAVNNQVLISCANPVGVVTNSVLPFRLTLTNNFTITNAVGMVDDQAIRLTVIQDATGGRTLGWWGAFTNSTGYGSNSFGRELTGVNISTNANSWTKLIWRYQTNGPAWQLEADLTGY